MKMYDIIFSPHLRKAYLDTGLHPTNIGTALETLLNHFLRQWHDYPLISIECVTLGQNSKMPEEHDEDQVVEHGEMKFAALCAKIFCKLSLERS